ncbi:MAG TPA: hypothetical protein VKT22_08510 [Steroidobacteraceae bacterium]|nr:hypothetical protein [Steroidobacteraceae bacterium]
MTASSNPNLYAPPRAEVADVRDRAAADLEFFPVSPTKLLVMSVCTLHFYVLYWFYQHWMCVKRREEPDIWPAARALFAIFWVYPLFKHIRARETALRISPVLAAGPIATFYIVLALLWRLPPPYALIAYLSTFLLLPAQSHANQVNEVAAPRHDRNDKLVGWNWVAVIVGGLFFVLVVVGNLVPRYAHMR